MKCHGSIQLRWLGGYVCWRIFYSQSISIVQLIQIGYHNKSMKSYLWRFKPFERLQNSGWWLALVRLRYRRVAARSGQNRLGFLLAFRHLDLGYQYKNDHMSSRQSFCIIWMANRDHMQFWLLPAHLQFSWGSLHTWNSTRRNADRSHSPWPAACGTPGIRKCTLTNTAILIESCNMQNTCGVRKYEHNDNNGTR